MSEVGVQGPVAVLQQARAQDAGTGRMEGLFEASGPGIRYVEAGSRAPPGTPFETTPRHGAVEERRSRRPFPATLEPKGSRQVKT